MSSQLDPAILAAITAEARQCFLEEDAPEYLQMLADGLEDRANPDFTALLRAAHSLKGGAGLASMTSLQHLAHKLEDVLVGLQKKKVEEIELAWILVEKGIDEIGFVVSQAHTADDVTANPELVVALEALMGSVDEVEDTFGDKNEGSSSDGGDSNNNFIRHTLTVDLENSLLAIEELDKDVPGEMIQSLLRGFVEECMFIAETLELIWLGMMVEEMIQPIEESEPVVALSVTKEIINRLRSQIEEYLEGISQTKITDSASNNSNNDNVVASALREDLTASCQGIMALGFETPENEIIESLNNFADECAFMGETLELPWLVEAVAPIESLLAEGDSLEALLTVQETIEEIEQQRDSYLANMTSSPKIEVDEDRDSVFLEEANEIAIASETEEEEDNEFDASSFFGDIEGDGDEIPSTVIFAPPKIEQKKVIAKVKEESQKIDSAVQLKIPLTKIEDMTNYIEELILSQSRISRQQNLLNEANRRLRSLTRQFEPIREQVQSLYDRLAVGSTDMAENNPGNNSNGNDDSFDSLEMDRYTDLHSSLQSFQELMLQIQETRTDIDFVDRELAEDLEQTQKNLDILYSQVNDSRLVPFNGLAKRFIPQIRGLSQRFDKPVNLEIEGGNTPVDQILLEQLQTPLTHLLNNAFDHGIESKYDRLAANKPETATIVLSARLLSSQLIITIKDDGGGIDLKKVYNRAVERGICPPDKSIRDFPPEQIVNWIFEPDFSTAAKVSDISGRGMGLDIVRNLIRQLRGQLQVQTDLGQGSIFTLTLPVNLSLQAVLLLQLQGRLIAIPHTSVVEAFPARELDFADEEQKQINWQNRVIPLTSTLSLFPCPRKPLQPSQGKVAIVLRTGFQPLTILVDSIIREEKLIVKPFDETVPVPNYVAGCAVLGSGEVVPVIMPQGLEQEAISAISFKETTSITSGSAVSTILVAEDSVATRRMLEKLLVSVGYQVIVCRDGQEAWEQVEQYQGKIDLILSDVEMPRMNGFELLEKVRAKSTFKNTPMVMATSRTGDRHKKEAQRLGATDYLGKPVKPQDLIATVAALLK